MASVTLAGLSMRGVLAGSVVTVARSVHSGYIVTATSSVVTGSVVTVSACLESGVMVVVACFGGGPMVARTPARDDCHAGLQVDAQIPLATGALFFAQHLFGPTLLELVPHARIEQCSELT